MNIEEEKLWVLHYKTTDMFWSKIGDQEGYRKACLPVLLTYFEAEKEVIRIGSSLHFERYNENGCGIFPVKLFPQLDKFVSDYLLVILI